MRGQAFIWSALAVTMHFSSALTALEMKLLVYTGFVFVVVSKFILPASYRLKLWALQ